MEKVFVRSFGCSANHGEGEVMKGILKQAKFDLVESDVDAEVVVLNICTVKGTVGALREIMQTKEKFPHKKLVVAGCVPKELLGKIRAIDPEASLLSTHNIHDIVPVIEETLNANPVTELVPRMKSKLGLPRVRRNPVVGIIPISNGCDSVCTFCSTKLMKGAHTSYSVEAIVAEIKQGVVDGCKEFWLTGQDTGCYGLDLNSNLPTLLRELCLIDGDFKLRLGMANPKHFSKFVKELVEVYQSQKMFRFLHIPVQSGNNEVLKAMKRDYSVEQFEAVVKELRAVFPDLTLSTDIIVGFPGETRQQFVDSIDLVKRLKFDVVNISRFVAREGTVAKSLPNQIAGGEVKERSRVMTTTCEHVGFERNMNWKRWEGDIVIDEKGKEDTWVGRNYAYKAVVVRGDFKLGQKLRVKITDVTGYYLWGEVV